MNEDFLYYLWKHQKFNIPDLITVNGHRLKIIKPGHLNTNSGPDFSEGHIKLDEISWYGQVEMHIKSSDWEEHNHQKDPAYNNVVLHVVWENDKEIVRQDGSTIPTLELKDKIDPDLLNRYNLLKEALDVIPCRNQQGKVNKIHVLSMIERCTGSRLEKKAQNVLTLLSQNKGDLEETAYQLTMKYLGFKINAQPMEQLARMLPLRLLQKNIHQQDVVEALLFGQAGLLKDPKEAYGKKLKDLYCFYKRKYSLPASLEPYLWKFMRMRPANFPTLRLAQIAAILVNTPYFFNKYLHEDQFSAFKQLFQATPSDFWHTHYHFIKEIAFRNPSMGLQAINLLVINVVAPLRAAYALYTDNYEYMESALNLLQQVPFEKNKIVKAYADMDFPDKSAFDSQGRITLFEDYCKEKRCLNCDIGVTLLKN
ncbi:MAG: DUF2851 family protein [Candidatus Cyclobacteriaceae bacterium M2_1C_046]